MLHHEHCLGWGALIGLVYSWIVIKRHAVSARSTGRRRRSMTAPTTARESKDRPQSDESIVKLTCVSIQANGRASPDPGCHATPVPNLPGFGPHRAPGSTGLRRQWHRLQVRAVNDVKPDGWKGGGGSRGFVWGGWHTCILRVSCADNVHLVYSPGGCGLLLSGPRTRLAA